MKTIRLKFITAASCVFIPSLSLAEETPAPSIAATTGKVAGAATKFLTTLDEAHRSKAVYSFDDEEQRKRWSNLPTSFVKRGGLRLGDLTTEQRDAAMAVVAAALSPEGYKKVTEIIEGDEVLKKADDEKGPGGRPNSSGPSMFGHDEYYISFVGQPSATEPWMLQFGGHHLAVNLTMAGANETLAPSHTAAQPAIYELEGKTVRPLGRESDKAFALFSSLDEAQRKKAILGFEIRDLVLGPGRDGEMIEPEGIKGEDLTDAQRALMLDLASEWTGIEDEAAGKAKMEEMKKNIAETWFAWSGPVEKGAAAYFRIQGPTVVIEYAPQTLGGDTTKHIHTIYRDPTNDYGAKWWKKP